MSRQKSFRRLVRARMEKTGESYTAARAALLAAEEAKASDGPALTMSDEAIRRRTGCGWEEWFDLLDEWGAAERPHKEIARWLREERRVDGWGAQSVTVSYERVGFIAKGEAKSTAALEHERLADAEEAERMKAFGGSV